MSIGTVNLVWNHSDHKGSDLLILLAIADNADDETGIAFPGVEYLASKARLSPRAIRYATQRILDGDEMKLLKRGGRQGKKAFANTYQIQLKTLRQKPRKTPLPKGQSPNGQDLPVGIPNGQLSSPNGQPTAPQSSLEPSVKTAEHAREEQVEDSGQQFVASWRDAIEDPTARPNTKALAALREAIDRDGPERVGQAIGPHWKKHPWLNGERDGTVRTRLSQWLCNTETINDLCLLAEGRPVSTHAHTQALSDLCDRPV